MELERVYLEISNICNLSCPFCSAVTRPPRRMSRGEFDHIIAELKGCTKYLYFHVKGEPLLHPDLPYFLKLCEDEGFQVHITTNGTLLKEQSELLLSSGSVRQVNLSLHSLSGRDRAFAENYLNEVLRFCQKAEGQKYVVLRLWNLSSERTADDDTAALTQKLEKAFALPYSLSSTSAFRRSVPLAPGIFLHWEEEFEWPSLSMPYISDTGLCQGLRKQIAVLADGTVTPCCLDSSGVIELGNLFSQPLEEILQGKRAQEMLEGLKRRKLTEELCRRCSYRLRFKG